MRCKLASFDVVVILCSNHGNFQTVFRFDQYSRKLFYKLRIYFEKFAAVRRTYCQNLLAIDDGFLKDRQILSWRRLRGSNAFCLAGEQA